MGKRVPYTRLREIKWEIFYGSREVNSQSGFKWKTKGGIGENDRMGRGRKIRGGRGER